MREGSIIAKYSYLSDGTKLTATDASGDGLYYLGSLVYRKQGGALSLESAAFGGGRFVATATGVEPHYFITDHLGSVRAVVNAVGEVTERNDYFPYGLRWENPTSLISDNRHRYNGKEEQTFVGLPYTDYGARMRDPKFRPNDWNGGDPLTEKTPGTSSYGFCGGNPVVRVDKDGKIWETLWDIGNLVYDVSAAIYNHVTGDHVRAKEHWSDAGMDLVATAIPVVPAGVSKVVRAADKTVDVVETANKVVDAAKIVDKGGDAATASGKTFQTYTKTNPVTGEVYSGRTSGYGDPWTNVRQRDLNHHKNKDGFGPARLDQSSTNMDAIRGREQQLINDHGGAKSIGGSSGNKINGIDSKNPKKQIYEDANKMEFGNY